MMVVEVGIGVQDLLSPLGCLGPGFFALLAFCLVPHAEARERYLVPWNQVEKETLEHFQAIEKIGDEHKFISC